MTVFDVDLPRLVELIERMTVCQRELERVDDEIDARMHRIHATWQGDAAALHLAAHRRWIAGSQQMRDALQSLRTIARTADENYTAATQTNRQMWAL